MLSPMAARREAQPSGVIETLSAGYAALHRQLWVLLLPILVDVVLWFGPHVSYSPLVDPAVTRATEWARQVTAGPRRTPTDSPLSAGLDAARRWLITEVDDINGLGLLARGPLGLPSRGLASPGNGVTFVSSWPQALGLVGGALGGGLLLGGWFYRGLAAASTGSRQSPLAAMRGAPRAVGRVLGMLAAVLGIGLLLGLPSVLLVAFTALVAPPVAILGSVLIGAALVLAVAHLFFAVSAIVVADVGPLAAVQHSVGIVRGHPWPSCGLIVLTWLIIAGMSRVWDALASGLQAPYGVGLSILGNAYIVSGLIAASMIFYIERSQPQRS